MHKSSLPPSVGAAARVLAGALRPWLILILVCAGFSLDGRFAHRFWTAAYLPNILQQAATNVVLAVGLTFVIFTAGIDLSVGSLMALCGVALGLSVTSGPPSFLAVSMAFPLGVLAAWATLRTPVGRGLTGAPRAIVAGLVALLVTAVAGYFVMRGMAGGVRLEGALLAAVVVGVGYGLLNGLVVAVGKVPPFVVTLGMFVAARGLTIFATDGNSVSGLPRRLEVLGQGWPLVAVAGAVVAAAVIFDTQTRPGRFIRSIGANEEAARLAGVNVPVYKTLAYVLSGLCAGVAAILLTAKFGVADTGAGTGAELNAIAAVVIGGTSLSGGRGSVIGSLVGALTIAVLNAGLVLVELSDKLQPVVIGAVIVIAVLVDRGLERR